jgi:MoaA/NifB/PqqE/SkfB family radical SAM enzyme
MLEALGVALRRDVRKVLLTGGEPLRRGDLEEIVRFCATDGRTVDLNTNAVLVTRPKALALKAAGVTEASVSIYGNTEQHDAVTQTKGSWERALRGLRLLRDAGIPVDVHSGVFRGREGNMKPVAQVCHDEGVSSLVFFSILPTTRYSLPPGAVGRDHDAILRHAADLRARFALPISTVGCRPVGCDECEMGRSILGITSRLEPVPCLLAHRTKPHTAAENFKAALQSLSRQLASGEWARACEG